MTLEQVKKSLMEYYIQQSIQKAEKKEELLHLVVLTGEAPSHLIKKQWVAEVDMSINIPHTDTLYHVSAGTRLGVVTSVGKGMEVIKTYTKAKEG